MGSRPTRAMTGRLRREKRDIHEGARRTTKGHEVRWICFNGANRRKVIHPGARASRPHPYSLWRPLSVSATLQAATTPAGTPTARAKKSCGAVASRSKWRRWPRLRLGIVRAGRPRSQGGLHPPVSLSPGGRAGYSCRNLSSCLSCASMCIHVQKKYRSPAPLPVDPSGGDGRGCARHCAGGTPALPGGSLLGAACR